MSAMVHAQIRVRGQVQGVGFRPFVYRLAQELGLAGWVRNDGEGVEIALEGAQPQVMNLIARLSSEPPGLARVEHVNFDLAPPAGGMQGFHIEPSQAGQAHTGIAPDMAVCPDCLAELFDSADRRYRYAFINCLNCGPRYTLTARLPYDRRNTSMAAFTLCPDCQHEYGLPADRRFHAQPNACPVCGPQLRLYDAQWQPLAAADPIAACSQRIRAGQVVAVKGVGGFHLVCDARNPLAVARLRNGKRREEKPFAVMVLNTASARQYAMFDANETALLESGERPIVLLHKSAGCDAAMPGIAPGLARIGLMLPYAPLHYLLFHELLGRPQGTDWLHQATPVALVMTSANPGGEPLVQDDAGAQQSLGGLADAFLSHNRDILHRCDDSVMAWQGAAPAFVRRARGYTPQRIVLPAAGPSVLACGAWLKNTVCLTRGNEAFVSQHIGDLDHAATRTMLDETVEHLCAILDIEPAIVAHDLHPDFYSTQFAQEYATRRGLPQVAVQHHHAHIAAVCAEHHERKAVLGLALDGTGLGSDGTAWGGELLRIEGADCERLGHLAPLAMPGGDRAAREPWRMAAAALFALGRGDEIAQRFAGQPHAAHMAALLADERNCATTSSMGRWFDAAAGLLGIRAVQNFEGQAAMLLQGLAERHGPVAPLPGGYTLDGNLDFSALLGVLADCTDAGRGAALFHATLCAGLAEWVERAAAEHNVGSIALGGGCFLNELLLHGLRQDLTRHGLRVLSAQQLPPNDGAISFGQAWVALQKQGGV
jgi:hydrogenase maturation protein HypF